MMKTKSKDKPQKLTQQQEEMLFQTLRTAGVPPKLVNRLHAKNLYADHNVTQLLLLAARLHPELAKTFDAAWEEVLNHSMKPRFTAKDSRGRGG